MLTRRCCATTGANGPYRGTSARKGQRLRTKPQSCCYTAIPQTRASDSSSTSSCCCRRRNAIPVFVPSEEPRARHVPRRTQGGRLDDCDSGFTESGRRLGSDYGIGKGFRSIPGCQRRLLPCARFVLGDSPRTMRPLGGDAMAPVLIKLINDNVIWRCDFSLSMIGCSM